MPIPDDVRRNIVEGLGSTEWLSLELLLHIAEQADRNAEASERMARALEAIAESPPPNRYVPSR